MQVVSVARQVEPWQCIHMKNTKVEVRCTTEEKDDWQDKANERKVKLAELIRDRMNSLPRLSK